MFAIFDYYTRTGMLLSDSFSFFRSVKIETTLDFSKESPVALAQT